MAPYDAMHAYQILSEGVTHRRHVSLLITLLRFITATKHADNSACFYQPKDKVHAISSNIHQLHATQVNNFKIQS